MPLTTGFRNSLLDLYFNATAIANVADNAASSPITNIYASLHTATPGIGGSQTTSEAAYTGYARVAVARTAGGWSRSGNIVSPVANIEFGECTASPGSPLMYVGLGRSSSGAGTLDLFGSLGTLLGAFTATTADVFTVPNLTGLANDDRIQFMLTPGYGLPTGITEGTVYFVVSLSGSTFSVSTTQGGGAVDITAAGAGLAFRVTPITTAIGVVPRIKTTTQILLM